MKYDHNFEDSEPWNMNLEYLKRVARRFEDCENARMDRDLLRWYGGLCAVYTAIHWKIKVKGHEEEEAELKAKFDELKTLFMSLGASRDSLSRQLQTHALTDIDILLSDTNILLHDLVVEYGLVILEKEKRNPARAIEDGKFK